MAWERRSRDGMLPSPAFHSPSAAVVAPLAWLVPEPAEQATPPSVTTARVRAATRRERLRLRMVFDMVMGPPGFGGSGSG